MYKDFYIESLREATEILEWGVARVRLFVAS